jgi:hypothetical protein
VTGEVSPASRPDESQPELRASHADRDQVVEALRIAAGDGRLTAEELDERLEAALTARTYRELAVLTADLPAPGTRPADPTAPAPKELMRVERKGGNASYTGHWVVPKRMEVSVIGGNVRLDFTDAVITSPTLQIDASVGGGNILIITRPGVVVDASEVAAIGGNVVIRAPRGPEPPTILRVEVSGKIRGGNIKARGPRRSFWQWLLGRQPERRPGG